MKIVEGSKITESKKYGEKVDEQSQGPITTYKEEVVEVQDESGRKRLVKRITKQVLRVNPMTGEREVASEQTSEEPFEDLTKQVSTVVEEIIEAPYSEPGKKRFMKRTIKYTIDVNPVTGEKEIVGTQQVEKPIQQDLNEPISAIKEEIVEVPSESGKNIFVKRIIKYLIVVDSTTGEKKVISKQTSDEPIEEITGLNDIDLASFTREKILSREDEYDVENSINVEFDNEEYYEGQSIIGKLKSLTKQEEEPISPVDDIIEDESYSGKELIDRIRSALVMEDVETNDVSDMDIHIDPYISNEESMIKENMESLIHKNYKEYEDFVDNNENLGEVVENQVKDAPQPVPETKTVTTSEKKQKKQKKQKGDDYDLYSVETTTTTVISGAEESAANYFGNGSGKESEKDKDCIIM